MVWEACQTFSGSWGYHRDEASWKSVDQLVQMLVDTVSKGGNLLLNVGPTGRGEFDERALSRLAGIGEWMKRHSRSIYRCTQAPDEFKAPQDCRLTYNPEKKRLYVHVFAGRSSTSTSTASPARWSTPTPQRRLRGEDDRPAAPDTGRRGPEHADAGAPGRSRTSLCR